MIILYLLYILILQVSNSIGAVAGAAQLILYAVYYRTTPKDDDDDDVPEKPSNVQLSNA